jgi:hypothetical protein
MRAGKCVIHERPVRADLRARAPRRHGDREGTVDPEAFAVALSAQADQVGAGLRDAGWAFDRTPPDRELDDVVGVRAAFCAQVAGERLLEAFVRGGEWSLTRALDTFDVTANELVRYLDAKARDDRPEAVTALEDAWSTLPADRRTLGP